MTKTKKYSRGVSAATAARLYGFLVEIAQDGIAKVTQLELADAIGRSDAAACYAVRQLADSGLIRVIYHKGGASYRIVARGSTRK